ncbi:MAG: N-6 DNA methylase [Candidatus Lokiarchaeota archaeon]|nr:N-6 DNA methylase [Candidatus Lokiarchaeota archaeon]
MSEFQKFLIDKGILSNLITHYGIDLKDKEINDFIHNVVEHLPKIDTKEIYPIKEKDDQKFDLDFIASYYEKIVPHSQRKTTGEFFTPIQIVDYILKSVGYTDQHDIEYKKLIDLSCGSGSFLIRAVNILTKKLIKHTNSKENSKTFPKLAEKIINKVKDNIYGIDINPIACVLCQINIYFTLFKLIKIIIKNKKDYDVPKFNILNKDTLQLNINTKYDYVVGNPPYLFIRSIPQEYRNFIEKLPLETNKGQYDYYQIFIELGIKLLKRNGVLGYIIPDSILALSNRKILRKYIYDSTKIIEIYYSGPQFDKPVVSNIILTLEKETDDIKRKLNQIIIKFPLTQSQPDNIILQNLIENWDYEFLINLNKRDIEILVHLNSNFPKLSDLMNDTRFKISLKRGVEIGKNGCVIYCETCQIYQPLPKKHLVCKTCGSPLNEKFIDNMILENIPEGHQEEFQHFLYSMNRYSANNFKYIRLGMKGINYKGENTFKKRIVIRQLSQENLICATYNENAWTSQSFYNLEIIRNQVLEFNHYYLLGLINSHLLSYYFLKSFGSYKILFPRILIEKLKNLPIKVPQSIVEKELAKDIQEKVLKILQIIQKNSLEAKNLANQVEIIVQKLYKIPQTDFQYIIKSTTGLNIKNQ